MQKLDQTGTRNPMYSLAYKDLTTGETKRPLSIQMTPFKNIPNDMFALLLTCMTPFPQSQIIILFCRCTRWGQENLWLLWNDNDTRHRVCHEALSGEWSKEKEIWKPQIHHGAVWSDQRVLETWVQGVCWFYEKEGDLRRWDTMRGQRRGRETLGHTPDSYLRRKLLRHFLAFSGYFWPYSQILPIFFQVYQLFVFLLFIE